MFTRLWSDYGEKISLICSHRTTTQCSSWIFFSLQLSLYRYPDSNFKKAKPVPLFTLNDEDQVLLSRVLELQLNTNRKGNKKLLPLSLYSTEVKGRKQIAGHLIDIKAGNLLHAEAATRNRYFNTLTNQCLVVGTSDNPVLTNVADAYLAASAQINNKPFWRGSEGDAIELDAIRKIIAKLRKKEEVGSFFKEIWFNVQSFFNWVPLSEIELVLSNSARMLFLFQISSLGWEVSRYYRLSQDDRDRFEVVFKSVPPTKDWSPNTPIEIAAAEYKDAGAIYQDDVRYRISGFFKAYAQLKNELGSDLPYFDRDLLLRSNGGNNRGFDDIADTPLNAKPATTLGFPHQLIVTGCPGSGKSYFINQQLYTQLCKVFRTQFHPESSFFDFVGAYKPQPVYQAHDPLLPLQEGDHSAFSRGRPLIDYRFVPGPLMQGIAYACLHPTENVVVLIDELNRGNAASILGDMLQLLDRDETGASRYAIQTSQEIRSFFAELGLYITELRLPSNFYIWATMNSADQGVFPLDTAFRRRWSYVYKGYSEPCLYPGPTIIQYGNESYKWDAFRNILNHKLVELGIHEDKLIGPYFLTEAQLNEPKSVLEKLFLYLYDDVLRFRQDTLFVVKSFSQVMEVWKDGLGKPLNIEFPVPVAELNVTDATVMSQENTHPVDTLNAVDAEEISAMDENA